MCTQTRISISVFNTFSKLGGPKRLGSNVMLAVKRSAGVALEVNPRNAFHTSEEACKPGIHPDFETQGKRHQKSKTGVLVAAEKGLMSFKNLDFFF